MRSFNHVAVCVSFGVALLVGGCKASVSANVKTNEVVQDDPPLEPASTRSAAVPPTSTESTSFIGVTHALSLTGEAATTPTCRCLAAVVSSGASNPAFQWRGEKPGVGSDAFVLAINGEGVACDRPTGQRGPSIRGIERQDSNVIVTIEDGRGDRPLALGAVIERPTGAGQVIFRTRKGLPYADPPAGSRESYCHLPIP